MIIINTYSIDSNDRHNQYWSIRENVKYQTKTKPKEDCLQHILDKYNLPTISRVFQQDICDTMLEWYSTQGYPMPHRTTGESIIKQAVFELHNVPDRTDILHSYYGIR